MGGVGSFRLDDTASREEDFETRSFESVETIRTKKRFEVFFFRSDLLLLI